MPASIGSRSPDLHAGAVGKLFLAHKSEREIERYFTEREPLLRYTAYTPISREAVSQEIRTIRAQGYSISNEEVAEGMYGIAAPIRDRRGSVVAAITIAVPVSRSRPDERERHQTVVIDAARRISANLGYRAVVALG